MFGEKQSIHLSRWPRHDPSLIVEETITLPVQVNGKMRGSLSITTDQADNQDDLVAMATADAKIGKYVTGTIRKVILVPGRILNIIV